MNFGLIHSISKSDKPILYSILYFQYRLYNYSDILMSCFSRFCLNKPKQDPKKTNQQINNQPNHAINNQPINNYPVNNQTANNYGTNNGPTNTFYSSQINNAVIPNPEAGTQNESMALSPENRELIDQSVRSKLGWAEDKTQNEKKFDQLGQTIYINQIGKSDPSYSKINASLSQGFTQWAIQDFQNQSNNSSKAQSTQLSSQQTKFPSPFIRYKIIPQTEQRMTMDVATQNQESNKLTRGNLIIWDYHGGPNQLFYIRQSSKKGAYYLVSLSTGFLVSALNQKDTYRKSIQPISVNPPNNNDNQLWKLVPSQSSTYLIQSVAKPNYVIDIYKERTSNGIPLCLWTKTGEKNQRWLILPA